MPGMLHADYWPFIITNSSVIDRYLSIIPAEAAVSASNNIGAHLSHRKEIYVIPFGMATSEYIVLYGEKDIMVQSVNLQKYNIIIGDKKNNFYLYRQKPKTLNVGP